MKIKNISILFAAFLLCAPTHGQTVFIYDQQSADEAHLFDGGTTLTVNSQVGQSFTPTFSSVGFIRVFVYGSFESICNVNLRSNSITGTIIGSSQSVALSYNFSGFVDFIFSTPIYVTPGQTYFFQPVVQSGGGFGIDLAQYHYLGGEVYINGTVYPTYDFWFREGILAPKISSIELTNGKPLIRFPTFSNQSYSVEYSPDLSSGSWSNLLGTNIQGTGQDAAVPDTNVTMSVNRFYRLKLVP